MSDIRYYTLIIIYLCLLLYEYSIIPFLCASANLISVYQCEKVIG